MFDVKLELRVILSFREKPDQPHAYVVLHPREIADAYAYIQLRGDSPGKDIKGQWTSIGKQDRRLPKFGKTPHSWHWEPVAGGYAIVLEMPDNQYWAKLIDFPDKPTVTSWGVGVAYNLPIGRSKHHADGLHRITWGVRINVPQSHVYDPSDDMSAMNRMFRPTGWFYDNSSGGSFAVLFGSGGGYAIGSLKFRRGAERCQIDYEMAGGGFGLHGAGWLISTESMSSWGTQVYCSPQIMGQMKATDFEGTIMVLNLGLGGSAGAAGSFDGYVVVFMDKVKSSVVVPNPFNTKAIFSYRGFSGGPGSPGASGQFMGFSGVTSVHTDRRAPR